MSAQNGHDRGNVTSIAEARKRAAEKAKAEKAKARNSAGTGAGSRGMRDWLVGGLVVAMAVGYIASFFIGTPQVTREGVQ